MIFLPDFHQVSGWWFLLLQESEERIGLVITTEDGDPITTEDGGPITTEG